MLEKDQPPLEGARPSTLRRAQPPVHDEADPSLLVRPEVRPGAFPGNEYIRFVYPRQPTLRRVRRGVLEATAAAQAPRGVWGRIKRVVIGTPIPTSRAVHERLTKVKALNVMGLSTPHSAVLSAVIFNALIIIALIPLALRGVKYRPIGAGPLLRRNLLIYGIGGIIAPFIFIKVIDLILVALHLTL
jgi:hypothetical protein